MTNKGRKDIEKKLVDKKPIEKNDPNDIEKPPLTITEWVLRYLWKSRFSKVIIVPLLILCSIGVVWSLLPTSIQEKIILKTIGTKNNNQPYSPSDFEVIDRRTIVDLRAWRKVPIQLMEKVRYCPVIYTNILKLEKKKGDANSYINNHWTRGFTFDVGCETHQCELKQVEGTYRPGEIKYNKFEITFDVSKETMYKPFTLSYQAIYWNSYQNERSESVGATISNPTRKLTFEILFPYDVPREKLSFTQGRKEDNNNTSPVENPQIKLEGNHLTWTIDNPMYDYFYVVNWEWDKSKTYPEQRF
jgi:hypothetical protein